MDDSYSIYCDTSYSPNERDVREEPTSVETLAPDTGKICKSNASGDSDSLLKHPDSGYIEFYKDLFTMERFKHVQVSDVANYAYHEWSNLSENERQRYNENAQVMTKIIKELKSGKTVNFEGSSHTYSKPSAELEEDNEENVTESKVGVKSKIKLRNRRRTRRLRSEISSRDSSSFETRPVRRKKVKGKNLAMSSPVNDQRKAA